MLFRSIIRLFDSGNVCVTGLRGTGKDLLMGNVAVRKKKNYISNLNYGGKFNELDFNKLDLGKNTYKNFINGNIKFYEFPYEMGSDIFISDCGIYFPSQYCNELNRDYKHLPIYSALSRQVSKNNVHVNAQNLNRVWDKIREQSDIYIRCNECFYFFGLVFQSITIYDKYESCVNRIKPCRITVPFFASRDVKERARMYIENFYNTHGSVKNKILIYFNKSKHNTYYFGDLLRKGVVD